MTRKLFLVFLCALLFVLIVTIGIRQNRTVPQPQNDIWLDKINIQTDNPQPAGKNITP